MAFDKNKESNGPSVTYTRCVLFTRSSPNNLGYDLSNVSFWTNVPDFDNKIDYDSKIIRHNWLHLEEYFRSGRNRIYEIGDKEALKKFSNKNYNFI